jgi:hypothetical protein
MSTCPGGAKKERKPQQHAYACPWDTKKEKKRRKKKKKPPYACPEGAKKMVGGQKRVLEVENACWGLKTCAGGRDGGRGCLKTELGVKRCCWGLKDAAGGLKSVAGWSKWVVEGSWVVEMH